MSPRAALPMRLEYVLLGLLRRRAAHGYELLTLWNAPQGIGLIWRVKPAALYAALEKLEQMGYLTATRVEASATPPRNEYRVTAAGEDAFMRWMNTPVEAARDFRQDFLVKVYFGEDLDAGSRGELLLRQEQICREWLASLERQAATGSGFEARVLSFRLRQVRSILAWLQELRDEDQNEKGKTG